MHKNAGTWEPGNLRFGVGFMFNPTSNTPNSKMATAREDLGRVAQ